MGIVRHIWSSNARLVVVCILLCFCSFCVCVRMSASDMFCSAFVGCPKACSLSYSKSTMTNDGMCLVSIIIVVTDYVE